MFPLFIGFIATDNDEDVSFFCIDAAYERLLAPHYSFGINLKLHPGELGNVEYLYFALTFGIRFYPMSEQMDDSF